MSGNVCVTLSTAIIVAVVGLTGCSHDTANKLDSSNAPALPATSTTQTTPPGAPLPPPEALTDVLNRLADPAIPGTDKLNLVEGSSPETAAALDRFTTASRDGGYLPMNFRADNIGWSNKEPGNVTATVVVTTANPEHREFIFPMEFNPFQGGWQLSRATAEMLLAMQNSRSSTSAPAPVPPTPAPPPTPTPTP
ncbi:hypothetical protein A5634_14175 [Mycobacterium asiaticum]|uniref:Low molecular weight antigen MTB12-like C-terminal domain-containing protein n=1 Tax=Mycobacterium asiaticum TaxID=1790 RepID=A0A1A3PDR6_MYCAS|nr:hypothetical protein [Mycobacterium asiaticum]OBK31449.1 hypothetical protein A5634_14175 [Mycobacterium asiaticum]